MGQRVSKGPNQKTENGGVQRDSLGFRCMKRGEAHVHNLLRVKHIVLILEKGLGFGLQSGAHLSRSRVLLLPPLSPLPEPPTCPSF